MSRAAPPEKRTPPMAGRERKAETQARNYSEAVDFANPPSGAADFGMSFWSSAAQCAWVERFKDMTAPNCISGSSFSRSVRREFYPTGIFCPKVGSIRRVSDGAKPDSHAPYSQKRGAILNVAAKTGGHMRREYP